MQTTTTTRNGFKVEDITFHKARRQSAIENEIETPDTTEGNVTVPVSKTPESIKKFLQDKIEATKNVREKEVFEYLIKTIDTLADTRKHLKDTQNELDKLKDEKSKANSEEVIQSILQENSEE